VLNKRKREKRYRPQGKAERLDVEGVNSPCALPWLKRCREELGIMGGGAREDGRAFIFEYEEEDIELSTKATNEKITRNRNEQDHVYFRARFVDLRLEVDANDGC